MSDGQSSSIPVFRSIAEIPSDFGPCVAAIGNFDGVHLGHRQILSASAEEARGHGFRSIAITFDPHPAQFLYPAEAPKLLTFLPERLRLLATTGVDAVLVLPFGEELSRVSARNFVRDILVGALGVRGMHEGGSFRFGHGAKAGVAELREFGAEFGFGVEVHAPVRVHGMEVSSSAVRGLIAAGDVRRARWMLGRIFAVYSTPARGRGIGTRLLVPTVNLAPYDGLLPAFGVYVTRLTVSPQRQGPVAGGPDVSPQRQGPVAGGPEVSPQRQGPVAGDPDVSPQRRGPVAGGPEVGERCFEAVTNVGNRPTFGEASFAVESHILDFEPVDLTEETSVKLEFLTRLRGEMTWPSSEALKAQIFKDVGRAKKYFRLADGLRFPALEAQNDSER